MSHDSGVEMEFRTMTIVYVQEDEEWCGYIMKHFLHYKKLKLNIDQLNVTALGTGSNPPELEAAVRESYVTMLLTSSYFLTYMEDKATWFPLMLRKRDRDVTTIVSALLHVTDDDIRDVADHNGYDYDTWELLEIDISGTNVKNCITQTLGFIDKNTESRTEKLRALRRKSGFSSSNESIDSIESPMGFTHIEMVPSSVNGAGEKVALLFKDEVEGKVTVTVRGMKEEIPTSAVNPYCVTFATPELSSRSIRLHVNIEGIRQCQFKLGNNVATPKFSSVELMCQSLHVSSKEELDKKLASTFKTSICGDKTARMIYDKAMESISAVKPTKQDGEYPTVVHWAAANGMRELCSALLSAPGSEAACKICNFHGHDPAELARSNGYQELSDFLMKFVSREDRMTKKELYLQLSHGPAEFPPTKPPPLPPRSKGPKPPPVAPRTGQRKPQLPPPR